MDSLLHGKTRVEYARSLLPDTHVEKQSDALQVSLCVLGQGRVVPTEAGNRDALL